MQREKVHEGADLHAPPPRHPTSSCIRSACLHLSTAIFLLLRGGISRGPDTVVITSSRIDGLSGEGDRDDIVLFASVRRPCCHREVEVAAAAAAVEPFPPTSEAPPPGSRDDQAGIGDSEGPRGGEPRGGGNGVRPSRACQREGAGEGNEADVGDRTATGTSGGGVGSPEGGGAGEDAAWAEEIADDVFDLYRIAFPRLPQRFTGTGDLAAALLLAWTHKLPGDLAGALERVAGSMRAVLTRTHSQGAGPFLLHANPYIFINTYTSHLGTYLGDPGRNFSQPLAVFMSHAGIKTPLVPGTGRFSSTLSWFSDFDSR